MSSSSSSSSQQQQSPPPLQPSYRFDNTQPLTNHPHYWTHVVALTLTLHINPTEAEAVLNASFGSKQFRTARSNKAYPIACSVRDPFEYCEPSHAAREIVKALSDRHDDDGDGDDDDDDDRSNDSFFTTSTFSTTTTTSSSTSNNETATTKFAMQAIKSYPSLLARKPHDIRATSLYLTNTVHMTASQLRRRPSLLGYSVETLVARAQNLAAALDVPMPTNIRERNFSLSNYNGNDPLRTAAATTTTTNDAMTMARLAAAGLMEFADERVAQRLAFLESNMDMSPDDARRVVCRVPSIVGSAEDTLTARIAFLRDELLGDGDEEPSAALRAMVLRMPSILTYSVDRNLRPKIAFAVNELGYTQSALANELLAFPAFLSYSLDKRLRPRAERMKAANVVLRSHHDEGVKLACWSNKTDDVFNYWLRKYTVGDDDDDDNNDGGGDGDDRAKGMPGEPPFEYDGVMTLYRALHRVHNIAASASLATDVGPCMRACMQEILDLHAAAMRMPLKLELAGGKLVLSAGERFQESAIEDDWSTFWDIRGPMSFQPAVRLCGAKALARVKASTGKAEEEAWNKARNCKT